MKRLAQSNADFVARISPRTTGIEPTETGGVWRRTIRRMCPTIGREVLRRGKRGRRGAALRDDLLRGIDPESGDLGEALHRVMVGREKVGLLLIELAEVILDVIWCLLVGTSLGAAVALQEAARDKRVTAVVAAETFSDLRTVATERAPFFFTAGVIARSFQLAEQRGRVRVNEVSPVVAAAEIKNPVLLIHGAADTDTPPEHSRCVLAALAGPKRLILVPGAGHKQALRGDVWGEVER